MNKVSILIVVLLLSYSLLSAEGRKEEKAAQEVQTAVLWHGNIHPGLTALVEKFNKENPNIQIIYEAVPFEDYTQKIIAAARTGLLPDLMCLQPRQPATWGRLGYLMPIEAFIKDLEASGNKFSKIDKYFNTTDGHTWGIPFWGIPVVVFGRKDFLADAGFSGIPKTWSDFELAAAKTTKKGEREGYGAFFADPVNAHVIHQWMAVRGADTFGPNMKLTINSKETQDVLDLLANLYLKGYMNKEATSINQTKVRLSFLNSAVAMMSTTSSFINKLAENPEFGQNVISGSAPKKGGDSCYSSFVSLSITKETTKPEIAKKIAKFFFKNENYKVFLQNTTAHLPVEMSIVESGEYWKLDNISPWKNVLEPAIGCAQNGWLPGFKYQVNEYPALFDNQNVYQGMFLKMVLDGYSSEQATIWAEKEMKRIMEGK